MKFSGRILSLIAVLAAVVSPAASANFHVIEINEVYSNADGSVQYVELISRNPGQTNLGPTHVEALNADGTQTTMVFNFTVTFSGPLNNGDTILIATPGFQAVAGFAPDFVMPAGSLISFPSGRVIFDRDVGLSVDAVAYGDYTGSNTGFGTPAAMMPCDRVHSLTRVSSSVPLNNAVDFAVLVNSPRRNNGTTTTLNPPIGADCNGNQMPDLCEVATGATPDVNHNRIPDVCEDRGDFNGDGDVDLDDYRRLHDCLDGPDGGILSGCDVQDLTGDGAADLADVAIFQNAFGTPPPFTEGDWYKPMVETTWQWQLQPNADGGINTTYDVEVYDIDLFDAPNAIIDELHASGRKVICYFSAGSYEDFRDDAGEFLPSDLGNTLDGFADERWLDIRSSNVQRIMLGRLDLAVQRGCDGVEPDNVDGFTNNTGFDLTATAQLAFNRFLANEAHNRNLAVALKNDLDQIPELVDYFDLSVNEQCHEFDECDALQPFIDAGKPVFNAEYADSFVGDANARAGMCADALGRSFHTLVLPLDLDESFRFSCDP